MAMALLIEVNDSYAVCGFVIIHSFVRSLGLESITRSARIQKRTAKGVTHGYHHASHHCNSRHSAVWRGLVRPRTLVLNEVDRKLPWRGGAGLLVDNLATSFIQIEKLRLVADLCGQGRVVASLSRVIHDHNAGKLEQICRG